MDYNAWVDCCGYGVIMTYIIAGFRIDVLGI